MALNCRYVRSAARASVLLLLIPLTPPAASAQDSADYYKKWLNEDALYLITDEERDVFVKLGTPEERDQFIEQFWLRRDPDPQTAENEFKIEHYRRILYANEKFTAGIPGWRTDRGRIYIKFGPPDRYETNPAGGSYERPRAEGGGHTSVAPFEIWEYRRIEGAGDDIVLEFVDDRGGGLYELTFDPQRKDDLLQVGFLGPTWDEIEAAETTGLQRKQDRVAGRRYAGDLSGTYRSQGGFQTSRDAPMSQLQLSAALNRAPAIRYRDLEAAISARVTFEKIPVEMNTGFIRISSREVLVPVTVEIPNSALTYKHLYGIYTGKLQAYGQVTTLARRREAVFEEEIARDFADRDYEAGRMSVSLFRKNLVLPPGLYKLDLVLKDVESGNMAHVERRLEVPDYGDDSLSMSSIILAASIDKAEGSRDSQFQFGSLKVVPRVNGAFRRDEEMGFYFQVYGLQVDPSSSRPKAKVEFAIASRGREPAYWRDASELLMPFRTHATFARIGSLSAFAPGDYDLRLRVTDSISGQQRAALVPFAVLQPLPAPR